MPADWAPKSRGFIAGWRAAEKEFLDAEHPEFINPYVVGSDEWDGYEDAVYAIAQK